MADETQSVTDNSTPVVASTDGAAPLGSQESTTLNQSAGDDTAGSGVAEGQQAEGSVGSLSDLPEYMKDIPTLEELQNAPDQPYKQALLSLRPAHEALLQQHREFEAKYSLLEKYGDVERVQSRLSLLDGLNQPVIENGQPKVDPQTFLPVTTTQPFIDQLTNSEPQTAERLTWELLTMPGASGEPRIREVFKQFKLDPARLDEYQRIDELLAKGGEVTPDDLSKLDPKHHDAFKRLTKSVREDFFDYDEGEQAELLKKEQRDIDNEKFQQEMRDRQEQEAQQKRVELQQQIETRVGENLNQIRRDSYTSIVNNLKQQVTFNADPQINDAIHGVVGSLMVTTLDPDFGFVAEGVLKALGVQLDPNLLSLSETIMSQNRNHVLYEQNKMADKAADASEQLKKANGALLARLMPIMVKVGQAIANSSQSIREAGESEFDAATKARQVVQGDAQGQAGSQYAGMSNIDTLRAIRDNTLAQ